MTQTHKQNQPLNQDTEWAEMRAGMRELREFQKETVEIIRKNDEKLSRMGISFGNFQNNMAENTEEMFYQNLNEQRKLAGITFDSVTKNVKDLKNREYDIVLQNGRYIALVEVKQQAHAKDIDNLLQKQVEGFRDGFHIGKDKKIILVLASPVVTEAVKEKAKKKGIVVLTQNGENVKLENDPSFKPMLY